MYPAALFSVISKAQPLKMSTPLQYYESLPPLAKSFGVISLMTSGACYLQLYDPRNIALSYSDVFKRLQVWRLFTNFFFLGGFSFTFAFRLLIILRYGVSLERGPFAKRTADYLWMYIVGALSLLVMAAIPFLGSPFMGGSLVFMIVYVWGREFPNNRISVYGLVEFKGFYLPWYMLGIDLILGNPLKPDMLGIAAGHIYYFLTVLHPLATGKNFCRTPLWVHKVVRFWGEGFQINSPLRRDPSAGEAFQGRSYRLNGNTRRAATMTSSARRPEPNDSSSGVIDDTSTPGQPATSAGVAFRGKSYRLGGR